MSRTNAQAMLRDMSLLLGIPLALMIALLAWWRPWVPDRRIMILTHRLPSTDSAGVEHRVAEYDLQEVSRRHVRGQIRGERRQTAEGEPVVWDLVLMSRDEYRWHRTDWPEGA